MDQTQQVRTRDAEISVAEIQAVILDIYKEFKKVCDAHGLRYYAVGGTCLGAVRHQGFIPWDDDMDIAMPDKDYWSFLQIAEQELPEHLRIFVCSEQAHNTCLFVKVHDIGTTFVEKKEIPYPDEYKGIYLDILPLCGFPDGDRERRRHAKRIRFLVRLNRQRRQRYSANRKLTSKALWLLFRPFDFLIPVDHWADRWLKVIGKYVCDSSPYMGYAWSPRLNETRIFPSEMFRNPVDLPFEDTLMRCPADYDGMLTRVFGDYMQLPKEQDRAAHSKGIVDIHVSYAEYAGKVRHD